MEKNVSAIDKDENSNHPKIPGAITREKKAEPLIVNGHPAKEFFMKKVQEAIAASNAAEAASKFAVRKNSEPLTISGFPTMAYFIENMRKQESVDEAKVTDEPSNVPKK